MLGFKFWAQKDTWLKKTKMSDKLDLYFDNVLTESLPHCTVLCLRSASHVHLNWPHISGPFTFSLAPIYTHAQSCTHTVMGRDRHAKACSCSLTYLQSTQRNWHTHFHKSGQTVTTDLVVYTRHPKGGKLSVCSTHLSFTLLNVNLSFNSVTFFSLWWQK